MSGNFLYKSRTFYVAVLFLIVAFSTIFWESDRTLINIKGFIADLKNVICLICGVIGTWGIMRFSTVSGSFEADEEQIEFRTYWFYSIFKYDEIDSIEIQKSYRRVVFVKVLEVQMIIEANGKRYVFKDFLDPNTDEFDDDEEEFIDDIDEITVSAEECDFIKLCEYIENSGKSVDMIKNA